jgi:voltage-gated sodium channel
MKKISSLLLNDKFILSIILLNVIVIFIGGFNLNSSSAKIIETFDHAFTIIFVFELVIKLITYGRKEYFKSNWNKFDFILVMVALPSLLLIFIPDKNISIQIILTLRIFRIFKFFRFMKFIPKIENIINGAWLAVKSSILIIIVFVVLNIVIAVFSSFLFKNLSPEHFGNPLISLYSTFKIFTIEGWYEIPEAILSNSNSVSIEILTKLYFIVILFGGGIFGLSLVNSIFVDSMLSDNNDELNDRLERIEDVLNDLRKSGTK